MKLKLLTITFLLCAICAYSSGNKENKPLNWDQEVILEEYVPFDSSRLAVLSGKSSLNLNNNLSVLDGATALFPVYASFVQAVYPKRNYNKTGRTYQFNEGFVRCTTTPQAYENLINGDVDIIFCMQPSQEQIENTRKKGLELNLTPIGKDAFVFIVNSENPVNSITSEQIREIYSGQITSWKELGWEDHKIQAFQRNRGSGSQTLFESIMDDTPIMEPARRNVYYRMTSLITGVAEIGPYPSTTIGYTFLFYTTEMVNNNKIKLLSIDGITPTRETIISGEYIFSNTFYAITAGNESENTKKFIEWIQSAQGQELIEKTGYVPVK